MLNSYHKFYWSFYENNLFDSWNYHKSEIVMHFDDSHCFVSYFYSFPFHKLLYHWNLILSFDVCCQSICNVQHYYFPLIFRFLSSTSVTPFSSVSCSIHLVTAYIEVTCMNYLVKVSTNICFASYDNDKLKQEKIR